ncbi:hypothetical protein [Streptomyces sp. NPDC013455]|uniref:hypothetical protein n=1 Tax=Streptomyces sp. NPDC013455 TaxID=3155605 RepID=UPI0033E8BA1F
MSEEYEMAYAHPDTVEGLLQRGRGLGAVRALRDPRGSAAHVYDGIRRDWRWDGTDHRSLYLARLVRDLELSPTPVVDQPAGDEEACARACEVLESLALAGSDEAREGLRAHGGRPQALARARAGRRSAWASAPYRQRATGHATTAPGRPRHRETRAGMPARGAGSRGRGGISRPGNRLSAAG